MKAILFPGQGSQIVGMGLEFYNNFSIVKKIFDEAENQLKEIKLVTTDNIFYLCIEYNENTTWI